MATAVQVESIWNGLTDNSGQPLAAGKVYTYYAGTSTPISLYTASDKSTSATNPLILDGNGKAQVWADGRYKFVVKSAADVTLYTLDNLLYGFDDSTVLWGGQSTGSASAQVVSVPATIQGYATGQRVSFIAGYTNTGAVTLAFNALSAVSIVKGPSAVSLQAGDIVAGQLIDCVYEAYSGTGRFRLESYPTLADSQRSRFTLATNVAGINTITADLTPAISSYETGLAIRFKAINSTTSASTININGRGAQAIQYNNAALVGGEIQANTWVNLVYDGTQFQLLNPYEVSITRWGGTSAGTSTAYTITPAPAITSYATGQRFAFTAHAANGATPTLAVNGLAAKNLFDATSLTSIGASRLALGRVKEVLYDGTQFRLLDDVGDVQNGGYIWLGTTGGTATAMTANATPAITAYVAGQKFRMIIGAGLGSTGSVATAHTLAINGIASPKSIVNNSDSTNPTVGTWVAGAVMELIYDGTNFRITNDPGGWLTHSITITPGAGSASGINITNNLFRKTGKTITIDYIGYYTASAATNICQFSLPVRPNEIFSSMVGTYFSNATTQVGLSQTASPRSQDRVNLMTYNSANLAASTVYFCIGGSYRSE